MRREATCHVICLYSTEQLFQSHCGDHQVIKKLVEIEINYHDLSEKEKSRGRIWRTSVHFPERSLTLRMITHSAQEMESQLPVIL